MSFGGNSDGGNSGSGGPVRRTFEDRTTGTGNRDAWNNPVRDTDAGGRGGNNHDAGGSGGTDDQNKNKNDINEDLINDIWNAHKIENDQNKNGNNNNNNANNNNNNNNNDTRPDPETQMNSYLKSVGLDPIVIDDAQKEKMQAGDFTDFITAVNKKLVNSHVKALSGAETMINAAVEKAVKNTKTEMQSSREGEQLRDRIHSELPFTKKASISPVAQSVAQRFIARGMSSDQAIEGVKAYFEDMNNAMNNDGVNKNRNANFSASHKGSQDNTPEGGWLSVLNPANKG